MNKEEIIKVLENNKNSNLTISTELDDISILNIGEGEWKLKTAWGWFQYSLEDLAEELSEWNEEIYRIY